MKKTASWLITKGRGEKEQTVGNSPSISTGDNLSMPARNNLGFTPRISEARGYPNKDRPHRRADQLGIPMRIS